MAQHTDNRMLLAPLIAGLVGAGIALLLAPKSGKQTREELRMKADKMKDQAGESMTNVRNSLDKSIEEAQDLKRRLAEAVNNSGKKARQDMDELQEDFPRPTGRQSSVLSTWEEEV